MWTIETLQRHINDQIEENVHLEYKAAGALGKTPGKKTELSKDVSSFANSDGGVIIYGIKENADRTPGAIDAVDKASFTKEWLEQVINSNISPRIHGITITSIDIENTSPKGVVYVVEVPKAHTAHQAEDKRYYRRFNFLSTAMEDWEIKDIINRQNRTSAYVRFRPKSGNRFHVDSLLPRGKTLEFLIIASNDGIKAVTLLDCLIVTTETVSKRFIPQIPYNGRLHEACYNNEQDQVVNLGGADVVLNTRRIPILAQTYRQIGEIAIWSDFFIDNMEIELMVSTDDNNFSEKLKGKEIVEVSPGLLRPKS
jgi:Putative DNA-binding domain